ncbi:MAG: polymerase [Veillonellaceae bacterium]|nr:polymerase [Veillonellaceae bacterium]
MRISYRLIKLQYYFDLIIEHCIIAVAFFLPLSAITADVFFVAGLTAWALKMIATRKFSLKRTPFDELILMFIIFSALSIGSSPDRGFSFYNYYNLMGRYILIYYLVVNNIQSTDQVKRIVWAILGSAFIVALYGFYQYLFSDRMITEWVDYEQFPDLKFRVFSTMQNPNLLAGFLVTIMAIAAGLGCKETTLNCRSAAFSLVAILAVCLVLTYSRGAWLSVLALIAAFGVLYNRKIFWLLLLLPLLGLFGHDVLLERLMSIFNPTDTSSTLRIALWESTVAMIMDKPFFGIGWGAYWMVYPEYDFFINDSSTKIVHAHNMYLNIAAEIGIPGLMVFLGIIYSHLKTAVNLISYSANRFTAGLMLGIAAALIALAVNGLTDYILFNIQMSMLFWLLNAIITVLWGESCRYGTTSRFLKKM